MKNIKKEFLIIICIYIIEILVSNVRVFENIEFYIKDIPFF